MLSCHTIYKIIIQPKGMKLPTIKNGNENKRNTTPTMKHDNKETVEVPVRHNCAF